MNADQLAAALCVRLHAPEWQAPTPRQGPCSSCLTVAGDIVRRELVFAAGSPTIHIEPPRPMQTVVVVCAMCGGKGQRRLA